MSLVVKLPTPGGFTPHIDQTLTVTGHSTHGQVIIDPDPTLHIVFQI